MDIDRSGIRSAYLGVKVQVRLGVDTQVLAEKRGEVQDPFVNLDNLVGRQLSARLRAALRGSSPSSAMGGASSRVSSEMMSLTGCRPP